MLVGLSAMTALALAPSGLQTGGAVSGSRAGTLHANADHDIMIRAARGEEVERTPVWLMRQAGRYMADFRAYSEKYPFRMRSETPEIAVELSLQPWRTFGVDGVIMFSDILTPLPALGIDFDVVKGTGPIIGKPLRSMDDVLAIKPLDDIDSELPFLRTILGDLRKETEGKTSLLGFVGSPFTLVAYAVEGQANRHCLHSKKMMACHPEILHAALERMSEAVGRYACHQIECGAQFIQFFESWAHHLGPDQFSAYAKPYADKAMAYVKARHPGVPVVYYANGGSGYLERQRDMECDMISLDWACDLAHARTVLGKERLVQGNVDPTILFGDEATIKGAVHDCINKAGGQASLTPHFSHVARHFPHSSSELFSQFPKQGHILNLGHGVLQGTPEENVAAFVNAAKEIKLK